MEAEDEIAVYDGELCVGAIVWRENLVHVLPAWKGDESYIEGIKKNNSMTFKVYKNRFKEEINVDVFSPDSRELSFEGSSYSRVSIKGNPGLIPQEFALKQNYPNPFNPVTQIGYHVAEEASVTLVVYNLKGQEVIRLMDNVNHIPGKYNLRWNAVNHFGENVSAGVYLVHMSSKGFSKTKKMVLLK